MEIKEIEYTHLDKFVKKWNTEGHVLPTENSPEIKIKGTDTYEWLPGGFFLLHKVDVLVGDDKNQTFEIIGFDKLANHFTMQHYDNKGNSGFMIATLVDDLWTFTGETLRFKGGFSLGNKKFSGIWEQSADGKIWTHFMDINLIEAI